MGRTVCDISDAVSMYLRQLLGVETIAAYEVALFHALLRSSDVAVRLLFP